MIRAVSALDATALAEIHHAAFGPYGWSGRVIADQLQVSGTYGLIHVGGGMALARSVLDEAEVLTLAVMPQAQRRGIGGQLLRSVVAQAEIAGCSAMFLEVSSANLSARSLYVRHGFQPVGMRRRYYEDGADALIMRASLRPVSAPTP